MKLLRRDPDRGYLSNMLYVPKRHVNVEGVKRALTFELPDKESMRLLVLWDETEHHIIVPRSFWNPSEFSFKTIDCRPTHFPMTKVTSRIKLDHDFRNGTLQPTGKNIQRRALETLLQAKNGTLQLKCGGGKTVITLELIARRQVPALIAVDNTHLMEQWQEAIDTFLHVPGGVGLIQGQVFDWQKEVVMATYQTLASIAFDMPEEVRRWFGLVVFDEGHHVSAPTFSRSAPLFYGDRLALTATPNRSDGQHVICNFHVGPVVFKDVAQELPPKIHFFWTGLELDTKDVSVRVQVNDKNGELHLGKLAGFFGGWKQRLNEIVIPTVKRYADEGRKILVLSNSVDEVINLMAIWTVGNDVQLYSEIPIPTPQELGLKVQEVMDLTDREYKKYAKLAEDIRRNLKSNDLNLAKRQAYKEKLAEIEHMFEMYEGYQRVMKEHRRKQRKYVADLLELPSTSGLFTEIVKPQARMKMLRERQVIFAIMKYGKEGLDDKDLDTVIMSEPVSDRNTLQQIMGRPGRPKAGKQPLLIILEDNIGPLISQCRTLRKHLREWPLDEGGPHRYELIGHPAVYKRGGHSWTRMKPLVVPGSS